MTPEEIDAYINKYRPEDRPKIRAAFEARRAAAAAKAAPPAEPPKPATTPADTVAPAQATAPKPKPKPKAAPAPASTMTAWDVIRPPEPYVAPTPEPEPEFVGPAVEDAGPKQYDAGKFADSLTAPVVPKYQIPSNEIPVVGDLTAYNPVVVGVNKALATLGPTREATEEELATAGRKFAGEASKRAAEARLDEIRSVQGREPTKEEEEAAYKEGLADVEEAGLGTRRVSPFVNEPGVAKRKDISIEPGESPDGRDLNPVRAIRDLRDQYERKAMRDFAAAHPDRGMTHEEYLALTKEVDDRARRTVLGTIGYDNARQNPLVPLDGVETQIERIKKGEAGYLPYAPDLAVAKLYAKATGQPFEETYYSRAMSPFWATIMPGFTEAELVDMQGKRLGAASKETWHSSILRPELSTPAFVYAFDKDIPWSGWGSEAHLRKMAEGADPTWYARTVGEKVTSLLPWETPPVMSAAVGVSAIAPVLMFDPDIPSLMTFGASKVATLGGTARKVLDEVAMAKSLEAAKAIEDGADLATYGDKLRGIGSFERNLVDHVEAEARMKLAADGATQAAEQMATASNHADILAAAEREVADVRDEVVALRTAEAAARRQVGRDAGQMVGEKMGALRDAKAGVAAVDAAARPLIDFRVQLDDASKAARAADDNAVVADLERAKAKGAGFLVDAKNEQEFAGLVVEDAAEGVDSAEKAAKAAADIGARVEESLRVLNAVRAEAKAASVRTGEALASVRQSIGRDVSPGQLEDLWAESVRGKKESEDIAAALAEYGASDIESIREILARPSLAVDIPAGIRNASKRIEVIAAEIDRIKSLGKEATEKQVRQLDQLNSKLGRDGRTLDNLTTRWQEMVGQNQALMRKYKDPDVVAKISDLMKRQAALTRKRFVDVSKLEAVASMKQWQAAREISMGLTKRVDDLKAEIDGLVGAGTPAKVMAEVTRAKDRAEASWRVWERAVAAAERESGSAQKALQKAEAATAAATSRGADFASAETKALRGAEASTKSYAEKLRKNLAAARARVDAADKALRTVTGNQVREALKRASSRGNINAYTAIRDDIYKAEQKLGDREAKAAIVGNYRAILAEKWRNTHDAFRAAREFHATGKMPEGAGAKAELILNKTARMANDQVNPLSRQILGQKEPFTYGFKSGLGLQADVSRFLALAKLRGGDMFGRAFDVIAARGWGKVSEDLKSAAGRGYGRYSGVVHEGNEVAKAETAARKESDRVYANLLAERRTASPDRVLQIDLTIAQLEEKMIGLEREYLTTTNAIKIGENRATVMNRGRPHAGNALAYLQMVAKGVEDPTKMLNDGVFLGLLRAWLPPGVAGKSIEGELAGELHKLVLEATSGEKFIEGLMNIPRAAYFQRYKTVESPMRAWAHIRDALYAGSATHDTVWDVMRAAGPRLTPEDAAVFDFMAEMKDTKLLAGVGEAGKDIRSVEEKLARWGMAFKTEGVMRFDELGQKLLSGKEKAQRLQQLGIDAEGGAIYLPQHILEAIREIPTRIAKESTQYALQDSPLVTTWKRLTAAMRVSWLYGLKVPHFRQFVFQPIGDFTAMAPFIGIGPAARLTLKNGVGLAPIIGTRAERAIEYLGTKSIFARQGSVELSRVLVGDAKYLVDCAEGKVPADQILREAIESRLWTGMNTKAMDDIAKRTFSGLREQGMIGKTWDFLTTPSTLVERMVDALEEAQFRQRLGLFVELRTGRIGGTKLSRDAAEKATLEATFDWQLSQLPWEHSTVGLLTMFWAYNRVTWRQTAGLLTEAVTDPSYVGKALTGQTRLAKTITLGQLQQTISNAINTNDDDMTLDDYEQAMEVGTSKTPWWATTQDVLTNGPITGAGRILYYTSTGKPVTHEAWTMPGAQYMDNLYRMLTVSNAVTATAHYGYEAAGGRPDTTTGPIFQLWVNAAEQLTGTAHPVFRSAMDMWKTLEDKGEIPDVTISRDEVALLNRLKTLGIEAPLLEQRGDKYVLDGRMGAMLSMITSVIPLWKDIARTYAINADNPGYSESMADGIVEALLGNFGIRPKGYSPLEDSAREIRREASRLKGENKKIESTK